MNKLRLATAWLDGCSGCHMSFLDIDERLLSLADRLELVYGPLVDFKVFPEQVDVTLVEGSVSTEEDLAKIRHIRKHTQVLVALGDCAVTSNVPGMRNPFGVKAVLQRVYHVPPRDNVPKLLPESRPIHEFVTVDVYAPGCPPSADTIYYILTELLEGRKPQLEKKARFG
jgi:NAD-reducing hydrogenase small subunit